MRQLSDTFIDHLKNDYDLRRLLNYVKDDNTLDIEIRENYLNIYYRGGNALKLTEVGEGKFNSHFDNEYFKAASFLSEDSCEQSKSDNDWESYFPHIKQAMDFYFTKYGKEEREFQQLVVRENNYSSLANSTDYFIVDIEYDNRKNARFDIVAIEWKSDASARKLLKGYKPKLVVIEMKYGDSALKGSAGIQKHTKDFEDFSFRSKDADDFKNEMLSVFRQKRQLDLIPCISFDENPNDVTQIDENIDLIFLLANHDPASTILQSELSSLDNHNIKFITSNFTGYGLFKENIFDYDQFKERFRHQIYNAL